MGKVLIIDDEKQILGLLSRIIGLEGYEVLQAATCKAGLRQMEQHSPEVVLCDVFLPDGNGVDLVSDLKKLRPLSEIILLTAHGNIPDGVQAIKNGAFDYITKGDDNNKIIPLVAKAMEKASAAYQQQKKEATFVGRQYSFDTIVGKSPAIQAAIALAQKVSATEVPVLLTGETGTGKEVAASLIHACSDRRDHLMVRINCSAIPEHLMESELFGYERGAFAGAMKTKKGLIELAAGGTVFLDEIGELPLSMQTKILTFLDHKKFKRVGGLEDIEVDARVIAATNRNLEHAVKQGEFREDLFYRINVMELVIPPLRDRREDIPALCDYYLKYYNGMFGKNITHVDPDFMRELLLYDWKGNVRELKNIFERCFLFCQGDVLEKHVELKRVDWKDDTRTGEPFALKDLRKGPISLDQEVSMLEQIYMDQALKLCGNNVTKAAALLGITRFSMKRRLDKED